MAQSVPSATSVPCLASLPAGLGSSAAMHIERGRGRLLARLRPTAATHAVEATLLPPEDCTPDAARPRCRATRPACGASSGPISSRPHLRATRTYVFDGGCVTYRFAFDGAETASLLVRGRRRARVPAARGRSSTRSATRNGLRAVRRRAPPCPGGRDECWRCAVVRAVAAGACCGSSSRSSSRSSRPSLSLRLLGIRRGWGTALLAGVLGWGVAGVPRARAVASGTGAPTASSCTSLAIGIPRDDGRRGHARPARRPGSLALGEHAGLVVAPRPLRAVGSASRCSCATASWCASRGAKGSARSSPRAVGPNGSADADRRPAPAGARGGRRRLRQARADRGDPRRPVTARHVRRARRRCRTGSRRNRSSGSGRCSKPSSAARSSEVFAEFDWEPLAAASIGQTYRARLRTGEAVVVKVQRPGIAGRCIERDLAALSLLADVAQRRTQLGQGIRSGEVLDQFAKSLRAELDFRPRGRRDGRDGAAARRRRSAVRVPKVYRDLCTRRLLVQERFEGFTVADTDAARGVGDRPRRARRAAAARRCSTRCCASGSSTPTRTPATSSCSPTARSGSSTSVRSAGSTRSSRRRSSTSSPRSCGATSACSATGSNGSPTSPKRCRPSASNGRWPDCMAENIRPTGAVEPTVLQDLVRDAVASSASACPAISSCCSRALVTLDGTLRVIAPEAVAGRRGHRDDDARRPPPVARPRRR